MRLHSPCSSEDRNRQKKNRESRTDPGKNISILCIERFLFHQADCSGHGFFGKDCSLFKDLPCRTDKSGDPCVCSPGDEHSIFDSPEGCNGEVLIGRRGFSKPCIIRDGDEEVCPLFDKPPAKVREDDLETDEDAEFPLRKREIEDLLSRFEISDPFSEGANEG